VKVNLKGQKKNNLTLTNGLILNQQIYHTVKSRKYEVKKLLVWFGLHLAKHR